MTRKQLVDYITSWNVKYPYDREWRIKHKISLFSPEHKKMCLLDIYMEKVEDDLYKEAREDFIREKKIKEEFGVASLRDRDYIPGAGNWLSAAEDTMSETEVDAMFDKIKF